MHSEINSGSHPTYHGDEVICVDNKTGKKKEGKVIRIDGPNTWVNCGPTQHKVPLRELILNKPRMILDSDKEDSNSEPADSNSELEEIEEIIPTRRRRLRRKSEELLVDKTDQHLEEEMVKIDKRRQAEAEELMSDPEDYTPRLTVWSDSDSEDEKPTRPKRRKWVYFQNIWGEEFEGYVTDVMKSSDKIIWATVNGARSVIDMTKISKWKYKIINPVSYMIDEG